MTAIENTVSPALRLSLAEPDLARYLRRQLATFFPDGREPDAAFEGHVRTALHRLAHCLNNSIWGSLRSRPDGEARVVAPFNHLHSEHMAMFVYLLANTMGRNGGEDWVCEKLYGLNKALFGVDVWHTVALPPVFNFYHLSGIVIGRATIGDFFLAYQGCTIGGDIMVRDNPQMRYPVLGRGVAMFAGSQILGDSRVGDNVIVAAGAQVINAEIPDNSIVFGRGRDMVVKPSRRDVVRQLFAPGGW